MILSQYTFFEPQFRQLINAPAGGMSNELERQANRVLEIARNNLSVQRVSRAPNPPAGPPLRVTGDLLNSLRVTPAHIGDNGVVETNVASRSDHRGFDYSAELRNRGYEFVRDEQLELLKEV